MTTLTDEQRAALTWAISEARRKSIMGIAADLESLLANADHSGDGGAVAIVTETHETRGKPNLYTVCANNQLRIGDRLAVTSKVAALSVAASTPIGWVNMSRKGLPDSFVWSAGDPEFNMPVYSIPPAPIASAEEAMPIAWTAHQLYDAIEETLLHYRMSNLQDDQGGGYPLVDHLTTPGASDIASGNFEVHLICDAIYNEVLTKSTHPAAKTRSNRER
jgi:hypothetical protein